MFSISSSYPLHQCRELWSHEMSSNPQIQTIHDQDINIQVNPFPNNLESCTENLPIFKLDDKYKAVACNSSDITNNTPNIGSNHQRVEKNKMKLVMRRDIEKRRRQEMSTLYAMLRSLLPLQYIKGRRSISDHMNEAANYIKCQRKKIQELKDKRDGLKRLYNYSYSSVTPGGISFSQPDFVTVQPCFCGLEIVISTSLSDGFLPLSRVLQALLGNGLTVSSCISTRVNERLLHTVQVEVSHLTGISTTELQQKLTDSIQNST